ncbi:Hypothetical protein, putative [Bodo saltans]|uniref:Receptor-type protein kinase n=1 Tax=Bodo saltans TaxID=75058 RepID=A0A0S4IQC3_BODSA|nr:Hypothetical protein, putative [Bodo saltans]|eukprot:CUE72937.1 Hypothetical protein, putative [Bodo saltans]
MYIRQLSSLRELTLSYCEGLSDDGLQALVGRRSDDCNNNNNGVEPLPLLHVVGVEATLVVVNISYCVTTTNRGVYVLVAACANLRQLICVGCPKIKVKRGNNASPRHV